MKVAILNDTHAGCRNSSDIFIKYQERFYNEVFFPYMEEHDIKQILHLGDYYDHRKYVNFKALNSNRKVFLDRIRELGIHMDIIPGNHDVFYKNTNDLCSLKPNEDRFCLVCKTTVDREGNLSDTSFFEAIINSKSRLTYGTVTREVERKQFKKPYDHSLKILIEIYNRLKSNRRYYRSK